MVTDRARQKISDASESGKPFIITTHAFLARTQQYIDKLLQVFLQELGLGFLFDNLSYCVKELGVNAKKANTKRIYFEENHLDISNPEAYKAGMEQFKSEMLSRQDYYLERLKEKGYYIKIEFLRFKRSCSVAVKNNVEILETERLRIQDKIEKAQKYKSLEDAFAEVLDESEGAGLGIVVLILMLKNLGFDGNFFQVYTHDGETIARIILPLSADE